MLFRFAMALLFLVCAIGYPAIAGQQRAMQAGVKADSTTIEQIASNPSKWYGKTVTVHAKVDDVFARTLFEVEHDGFLGIDEEVLVVVPRPDSYRKQGEWVTITGVVRRFVESEVERTVSGTDWSVPDEVVVQFDERPSIVASSVVASTEQAGVASTMRDTSGQTAGDAHVSIEQIAEHPEEWYGKTVTVRGKVDDIFHRNVFDVEEGGFLGDDELLIVQAVTSPARKKDEWLSVTGRVQRFVDLDLERQERDGDARLPDEVTIQFEKRPVIVATRVTPVTMPDGE
jgi:hypothetical protein